MDREISLDYLAGLMDGEGSIFIGSCGPWIRLGVSIVITDEGLLRLVHQQYGGSFYSHERGGHYKTSFKLLWQGVEAQELLRKLVDRLFIKKEATELAFKFPVHSLKDKRRFTPEEVALRKSLETEMKKLNQRGCVEFIRQ